MRRKQRIAVRVLISLMLLAFLGSAICLLAGNALIVSSEHLQKVDVIIVLGYPAASNGEPSSTMKARVDKGVELFKQGYAPHLIFTGAAAHNQFVEADVMGNYAESLGVPPEAVSRETRATDTIENAANSVSIMQQNDWHSAIVVTTPYHTGRAYQLFLRQPIAVTIVAAEQPPDLTVFQRLDAILHEFEAYGWYAVSGTGLNAR
jgi:uncharacterized SAM-binding protein YcdF (DUF218 family)